MTDRSAAVWVGVFFLCIFVLTAGGHYGGDGFWSYLTAESLILDGDVRLGDRPFLVREMANQFTEVAGAGITQKMGWDYSKYGLGLALIEIPFYVAGRLVSSFLSGVPADYITMFAVSLTNTVISALWCALFFLHLRDIGYGKTASAALTASLGLGSPVLPYASYGFSEPLVGLCLLTSIHSSRQYQLRGKPGWVLFAGASIGLAFLAKYYAAVILPVFSVYLWFSSSPEPLARRMRCQALLAAGFVPFGLVGVLYNYARFGSLVAAGYHLDNYDAIGGFFDYSPFQLAVGFYGLILSSGRGLLVFVPVCFLTVSAYTRYARRNRSEAILSGSLVALHLAFYAGFVNWDGGSSWGPRFVLPIVPLLVMPLGTLLEAEGPRRKTVIGLSLLGLLANSPVTVMNSHQFVRFVEENQIGYAHRAGGTVTSPSLSPILGSYYQMASAASRAVGGKGICYPVASADSGRRVSLVGYDQVDLWWLNAAGKGFLGVGARCLIAAVVLLLASLAVFCQIKLYRWIGSRPLLAGCSPAGPEP